MVSKIWREWRFPVEFALLLALAFFLPLREAPKNLFWLAYVVVWVVNRVRSREWGGRWDGWDTLILLWLGSGYLAALFAGIRTPEGNEWGAVNDLVRYAVLLFCVRRAGYTLEQCAALLIVLLVSCVAGTLEGIWNWRVVHKRKWIELVSVGHVNHSAIYIVICLGAGAGMMVSIGQILRPAWRGLLAAAIFFLLASVFAGESRAAVLAALSLLAAIFVLGRTRIGAVFGALAFASVIGAAAVLGGTGSLERQIQNIEANNILSERDLIWNRALVAVRAAPWFGVGMDNFSRITDERLKSWLAEQQRTHVERDYARAPHGHSLYINTVTERGLVGLAVLLAILGAWAVALVHRRPDASSPLIQSTIWYAAFSAWFVTVVIGVVNTTMHHEHAMLAVTMLAMLIPALPAHPGRSAMPEAS